MEISLHCKVLADHLQRCSEVFAGGDRTLLGYLKTASESNRYCYERIKTSIDHLKKAAQAEGDRAIQLLWIRASKHCLQSSEKFHQLALTQGDGSQKETGFSDNPLQNASHDAGYCADRLISAVKHKTAGSAELATWYTNSADMLALNVEHYSQEHVYRLAGDTGKVKHFRAAGGASNESSKCWEQAAEAKVKALVSKQIAVAQAWNKLSEAAIEKAGLYLQLSEARSQGDDVEGDRLEVEIRKGSTLYTMKCAAEKLGK